MSKLRRHALKLVPTGPAAEPANTRGKVVHDQKGNAIWDWAIETDVLEHTSTTGLLRKLGDPAQLALENEADPTAAWSGDPYNRTR
jgi:hypothetical protein